MFDTGMITQDLQDGFGQAPNDFCQSDIYKRDLVNLRMNNQCSSMCSIYKQDTRPENYLKVFTRNDKSKGMTLIWQIHLLKHSITIMRTQITSWLHVHGPKTKYIVLHFAPIRVDNI